MIIDSMAACKTLRAEAYVTQVERTTLFGNERALSLMAAACTQRAQVTLG